MVLILDMTLQEKDNLSDLIALTDDYLDRMHAQKSNRIAIGRRLTDIYDVPGLCGITREWSPHVIKMTLPIDPLDPDSKYLTDVVQRLTFLGIGPGTDDYRWILAEAQDVFNRYLIRPHEKYDASNSPLILPGTKHFHM